MEQNMPEDSWATGTHCASIGTLPPVEELPAKMLAQRVRQDRFGDPQATFQIENDEQANTYNDIHGLANRQDRKARRGNGQL